jgi:ComF family protein
MARRHLAALGARGVRALTSAAVDFVYPRQCAFCGGQTIAAGSPPTLQPSLCADCRQSIAPPIENPCRRCGAPGGPHLETSGGCVHCRRDRFRFESVLSLGVYSDMLRVACRRAKQPGGRPLAAALAGLLWERHGAALTAAGIDVVAAVPRHWTQRLGRAHNTAETQGEVLARRLQVEFGRHILAKVRRTPAQSSLPATQRRTNLRRAFQVRGNWLLEGASVLLVDDVLTTGSTANEVSRALQRGGAKRIVVAVSARGIGL